MEKDGAEQKDLTPIPVRKRRKVKKDVEPLPQRPDASNRRRVKRSHLGNSKTKKKGWQSQKNILAREKERRALELRKAGASFEQIANQLGYASYNTAYAAVKRAMGRMIAEPVSQLRALQYERLNTMMMLLWPQIQAGDQSAMKTGTLIMDMMNQMMGVNAATRVDVDHSGAVLVVGSDPKDYVANLRRMAGVIDVGEALPNEINENTGPLSQLKALTKGGDTEGGEIKDALVGSHPTAGELAAKAVELLSDAAVIVSDKEGQIPRSTTSNGSTNMGHEQVPSANGSETPRRSRIIDIPSTNGRKPDEHEEGS